MLEVEVAYIIFNVNEGKNTFFNLVKLSSKSKKLKTMRLDLGEEKNQMSTKLILRK